jgi:hypothetical protein
MYTAQRQVLEEKANWVREGVKKVTERGVGCIPKFELNNFGMYWFICL